ncbi:hypothetical protein K492DRAFT_196728 [Lichtheimia hyalospora FSU 10163]|nr:hypothetical protein K492DRAFT_196728 [Lichtheimia hyalospora FSU 10163]
MMTLSTVQQVTDDSGIGADEEDSDPTGDDAFSGDPTGEDSPNDSDDPNPSVPVDSSPSPIDTQPTAPQSPLTPSSPAPIAPSSPPIPSDVTSSTIEHIASTTSILPSNTFDPAAQIENSDSSGSGGGRSPGAIAGGILGGLAGIAILGGIFFLCLRKKPVAKAPTELPQTSSSIPPQAPSMSMAGAGTSAAAGATAMNPFNDPEKQLPPPPPPPQPQVVGFHAWNAASSSDMLASSAAHYTR